ncbi:MAG TPA: RsmG family class I SAM-dependent methyltransferase [Humidesulfovibrio sp.]|uniref:16S rRNA (guanine(527)-N(7))-methyltransferase RsmG n=1 Tax=Humidesulfovibrio sp. TaxID=2910988 RepID=UPI002BD3DA03|nr:RsmG family class I SAM-dependent methyltransferase [Humidesulfovibrio sp.]HWR03842.1 RsmG family class I SAM-dependent methyltransferase [Humidesulfovibrio sp.]
MIKKRSDNPYAPAPGEVSGEARRAGFKLDAQQAEALSRYLTLLLKWNRAMNLVGRADWPGVFRDLAADSLHLAEFLKELPLPEVPLTLDLGAGAGLPGIPLRVLWPRGDYVLVELREKRAIFLTQAVGALKLPRTFVLHGRAEASLAALPGFKLERERADVVLSRAFMPWPQLLPLAAELLAPGGTLVILANEAAPVEQGADMGAGFRLSGVREYPADGRSRYFWSLVLASA